MDVDKKQIRKKLFIILNKYRDRNHWSEEDERKIQYYGKILYSEPKRRETKFIKSDYLKIKGKGYKDSEIASMVNRSSAFISRRKKIWGITTVR